MEAPAGSGEKNMEQITVRPMQPEDWAAVSEIYLEGIATEHATFQTACPPYAAWDASHTQECRLVALLGEQLAGWAALHRVDPRWCYRGVAEVSIYMGALPGPGAGGRAAGCPMPGGRAGWVLDAAVHRSAGQRSQPPAAPEMRVPTGGAAGADRPGLPRPLAGHLFNGAPLRSR